MINFFDDREDYDLSLVLDNASLSEPYEQLDAWTFTAQGIEASINLDEIKQLPSGSYDATLAVKDLSGQTLFSQTLEVDLQSDNVLSSEMFASVQDIRIDAYGSHQVKITTSKLDNYRMELYNPNGQKLMSGQFYDNSHIVSVNSTGLYILKIWNSEQAYTEKVWFR